MSGLDAFDQAILVELRNNARLPHAELAKRVNLSRNAVRQRVERLEQDGTISGYTTVRGGNPSSNVVAMMLIYRNDRMRGAEVLAALKAIPEVITCDIMSGDFDIVVRLEAETTDRVREIWEDISDSPDVRDTVTSFALSTHR